MFNPSTAPKTNHITFNEIFIMSCTFKLLPNDYQITPDEYLFWLNLFTPVCHEGVHC